MYGTGHLRRLPESGREVREIGALFDDESSVVLVRGEATGDGVRGVLANTPRLAAVHFACHGLVDLDHPLLSCLALSHGDVLTVADVARLDVDADLVVISACNSARGRFSMGEGVNSLARAFMIAGAPRVVASLWSVDDVATRTLMKRFYQEMVVGQRGANEALRRAKLSFVHGDVGDAHPARWAGFVLWGLAD